MAGLILYELIHEPTQALWKSVAENWSIACNQLGYSESDCRRIKRLRLTGRKRKVSDRIMELTQPGNEAARKAEVKRSA